MGKVQKLDLNGTVDTCPVCGYTDGFHVSFKVDGDLKEITLICPQCHNHFDPEWKI
jgi:transcription elongation factor Elf1